MPDSQQPLRIRIGTRGSPLARWQADWVADRLRKNGVDVELVLIATTGDVTEHSLSAVGGQGLFTKEIQRALLDRRADVAVHSLKDLPTEPIDGVRLAAVPPRETPQDVLVSPHARSLEELPAGARVGTGSRRRQSQLLHVRPDLQVSEIRGNVDTRLKKLDEGQYDALVLAAAGLIRLKLEHRIGQWIPPAILLPAVGQGALGLEVRANDDETLAAVRTLNDANSLAEVVAERSLLAQLRAGCLAPVGAWTRVEGDTLRLNAAVLSPDGRRKVSVTVAGKPSEAAQLGQLAAHELLSLGAAELIEAARQST